jgi:glycosyltransferase involved in cell wall biosynthesis
MKICLNMIVKNEGKIIARALHAAMKVADCFCICDTGSTDDTIAVIQKTAAENRYEGVVVHHEFVDFAATRNAALRAAQHMGDYILLLDADMVLVATDFDKSALRKAGYLVKQGNDNFAYSNVRLVKSTPLPEYVGATHEYVRIAGETEQLTTLSILDHGDGGCKADKFERDIRLLKAEIEVMPNNDRSWFYLANSYFDTKRYAEAAAAYVKRIDLKGWVDEVFYSMYRLSMCYKELGDEAMFIGTALNAWRFLPKRIESIYELVKFFKEKREFSVAAAFYKMVAGAPCPDGLFVHTSIYTHDLDFEYTMVAYAAKEPVGVYKVYKKMFETAAKYLHLGNYKFYAPLLEGDVVDFTCEQEMVLEGATYSMQSSTPSIVATEGGYALNVRLVNYKILDNGGYSVPDGQNVTTANKRLDLDKSFAVVSEQTFDPPALGSLVNGLEDVRLVDLGGVLHFTANKRTDKHHIFMAYGMYENPLVEKPITLHIAEDVEKNWVFLPSGAEMVYKWSPLTVGEFSNGRLHITKELAMPKMFELARGSSNGAHYNDEIWFIVHFVHQHGNEIRYYYHGLVVFDEKLGLKRYTLPFKLSDSPVEYCLGLVVEADRVILSYSDMDRTAKLLVVSHDAFDAFFV